MWMNGKNGGEACEVNVGSGSGRWCWIFEMEGVHLIRHQEFSPNYA